MNSSDLLAKALFEADITLEPVPEKENAIQDVILKPLSRKPVVIHSSVFAKQGPSNEKIQFPKKADLIPTIMNLSSIVPEDISKIRNGIKQMPESFKIRQPIHLASGGLLNLPTPNGKTFHNVSSPHVSFNQSSMRPEDINRTKSEIKGVTKPISSKPIVICNPLFANQKPSNGTIQFHIKTQDLLSKALNLSDITLEDVPEITNGVEVVPKHSVIPNPLSSASKGVSSLPESNARTPSIVKPNDSLSMACNVPDFHTKSANLVQPSGKEGKLKPFLVQSSKANPKQESVNLHIPNVRYSLGTAPKLKPVVAVSRASCSPQVLKLSVPGNPPQGMNNSTMMPIPVVKNEANGPYYHNGNAPAFTKGRVLLPAAEEHIDEEDELGLAETYADYMPSKLKLGERHPDPVVESSSLSSVPPPDIWYRLCISEDITDSGLLSALQLEAITYACQQHETILPDGNRAGFLVGDGAGVGKGRTLAGIIYENYLLGRKRAIWLSVSSDLKYDAERDFSDINASEIKVYSLNKFKYAKIASKVNGKVKRGVIFATYSSLIGESQAEGKYNTRMKQLLHWCGGDFDGCIVFDECHKAKNLCPVGSTKPTKTGLTVLDLQNKLPKARIVYASATGATEPKNMAYMTRLGLWGEGTPFKGFSEFISVVEKRGVGAMELVAMDMKLRGLYMARQLSFAGVSFKIEEIPLSESFRDMYNRSVSLWVDAHEKFETAAELMRGDSAIKRTMWCQFWASHQRFFKYLCIASKVSHVVHLAREAVKNGKCVVIGLQSTGEAQTSEQLEEQGGELSDFVSTAKGVFQSLIEKQFPAPDRKKTMRLLGLELSNMIDSDQGGPTSSATTTPCGSKRKRVRFESDATCHEETRFSDESSFEESADDEDNLSESDVFSENSSCEERRVNCFDQNSDSDDCSFFWKGFSKFAENPRKLTKKKVKERKKRKKGLHKSKVNKAPEKFLQVVDVTEKAAQLKQELLQKLDQLENLPVNTLDQLIEDLGGPDCVAEMTGRKGRIVSNGGAIQYEVRSENDVPLEVLNLTEKQRFMNGEKNIAIISEAASSGISLHSDRRVRNQARRVHMTLELPWSADRAIQQFGRTHRSNQVNAPEYVFLISNLAGERRFASVVAKRLESLGALTHGDRRATESRDLSKFNFDTKYGRTALDRTIEAVMEHEKPMVPPPVDYQGPFFLDVRNALYGVSILGFHPDLQTPFIEKGFNMTKFLNRILGVPVGLQNTLFKYFTDTLDAIIQQAKKSGRYDMGILDLGAGDSHVKRIKCNSFIRKHATGTAKTELHTVLVERGLSWEDAVKKCKGLANRDEGFYVSVQTRNNHRTSILAVLDMRRSRLAKKDNEKFFRIYRPNTGLQAKQETLTDLKSKYRKSSVADTETYWKDNFHHSKDLCSHVYWHGHCRKKAMNLDCEIGLRQRTFHVLSGSVLSIWTTVENVISSITSGTQTAKLQVVRLRTDDKNNTRIVGCLIPDIAVASLVSKLSEDSNNMCKQEQEFS